MSKLDVTVFPPLPGMTIAAESEGHQPFVTIAKVPGRAKPTMWVTQIYRWILVDDCYSVTQSSEPLTKHEATLLRDKWSKWHRVEVRDGDA